MSLFLLLALIVRYCRFKLIGQLVVRLLFITIIDKFDLVILIIHRDRCRFFIRG